MNVPALRNVASERRLCRPLAIGLPAFAILALPSFVAGGEATSDDTAAVVVSRAATEPRDAERQPAIAIRPGTADMPTVFTSQIEAREDEEGIAQEISRRFQADDLGNYTIDVSVIDGVVTLDGFVLDEETRGRAAKIAQQVQGVESIRNRIVTRLRQAAADRRDAARTETMSKESAAKDAAFRKAAAVKKTDAGDRSEKQQKSPRDDRGGVTVNVIININVDSGNHYGPPPQRSARDSDTPDRPAGSREAADDRQRSLIEQMMQRFRGGPESRRDPPGSPEFREELEQRQREMEKHRAEMRQRMEQMQREMRERSEQRDRENEARENEARENEARENEARENEARERERREGERREQEARERESFLEDEARRDREPREREREELEAPRESEAAPE